MTKIKKPQDGKFYLVHNDLQRILHTPYEFAVLCKLIQHTDSDGNCFPSQKCLAQGIMTLLSVSRATKSLEQMGYIFIEHHPTSRRMNLSYLVNFPKIYEDIESLPPEHQTENSRTTLADAGIDRNDSPPIDDEHRTKSPPFDSEHLSDVSPIDDKVVSIASTVGKPLDNGSIPIPQITVQLYHR